MCTLMRSSTNKGPCFTRNGKISVVWSAASWKVAGAIPAFQLNSNTYSYAYFNLTSSRTSFLFAAEFKRVTVKLNYWGYKQTVLALFSPLQWCWREHVGTSYNLLVVGRWLVSHRRCERRWCWWWLWGRGAAALPLWMIPLHPYSSAHH